LKKKKSSTDPPALMERKVVPAKKTHREVGGRGKKPSQPQKGMKPQRGGETAISKEEHQKRNSKGVAIANNRDVQEDAKRAGRKTHIELWRSAK